MWFSVVWFASAVGRGGTAASLTLHEPQEDQRGQPRHRHGEEQDATATAPVHGRPQQQPGPAPRADGQQVGPVEAGGGASDVASEGAVAVADAVGDESKGGGANKHFEIEEGVAKSAPPLKQVAFIKHIFFNIRFK